VFHSAASRIGDFQIKFAGTLGEKLSVNIETACYAKRLS